MFTYIRQQLKIFFIYKFFKILGFFIYIIWKKNIFFMKQKIFIIYTEFNI